MGNFGDRLKHAWSAFMNKDPTTAEPPTINYGPSYSYKPDRVRLYGGADKSIINTVCNRIAVDAASVDIKHVKLDEQDRFLKVINDSLNQCLTVEANIDQTGRQLIQDIVMSMLDEGCVAVVPVECDTNPKRGLSFQIYELRTGKIVQWYPEHVKVRLYNERNCQKVEMIFPKRMVAVIENPFYSIMNSPNSTAARLRRKLSLLDTVDEHNANGANKLNMIVQFPYQIKGEARRELAKERIHDMENQLSNSPHGIAYSDATEKIIQLNRSLDTDLQESVEYLTNLYLAQLGMTQEILNGTANSETMNNYMSRIVEPILSAITEEFIRKFLSKTARSQKQSIMFFRDPFKLVPVDKMAELSDKLTRNAIVTSNEVRQGIGMIPSEDPDADVLRNKNISEAKDQQHYDVEGNPVESQNGGEPMEEPVKQYSLDEIKAMRPEEKKNLIVQTANELLQSNLDEEDRQTVSALANMSDETINSLSDEDIMEIINGLLESK